jgi:excisionase family DNA binding protein
MYRTPEEIAEELQVTRRTVYGWLRSGRLRGVRAGRGWRIRPEDVEVFLRAGTFHAPNGRESRQGQEEIQRPIEPLPLEEFLSLSPEDRVRRNQAAREVLQSFMEEDEKEQRETWEELKQALDEDRLSYRKLFP